MEVKPSNFYFTNSLRSPHADDPNLSKTSRQVYLTTPPQGGRIALMEHSVKTITIRSFAKINLTLDVLETREDGYHNIESVMQSIGLHDVITIKIGGRKGIRLETTDPEIPTGEKNLAYKAAALMLDRLEKKTGVSMLIEKRIPAEAGLGGGSSNAAAVIRCLDRLLSPKLPAEEKMKVAAEVGSDVPFFLVGGTASVMGRGETVQPLPDIPEWFLVIAKPRFGVSTQWAYKRFDELRIGEQTARSWRMLDCIQNQKWEELPQLLYNDLEIPAIEQYPDIVRIKTDLTDTGAHASLMCGSGSAVYGLYPSLMEASRAAEELQGRGSDIYITSTITRENSKGIAK